MDIGSASNNQLIVLIAIFFGLALAFAGVIVYVFVGFRGGSKNYKKKKQEGVKFSVDLSQGDTRKDETEIMPQETNPRPRGGLLKSAAKKGDSPPSRETTFPSMSRPDSMPLSSTRQEMLKVLIDRTSGDIIVEVDGQQYEHISQVKERAVGQRILEVVSLLLKFTGGMIATASGFKTLPVPPAKLTGLPPQPQVTATSTSGPDMPAPEVNLAERLGQSEEVDQSSWPEQPGEASQTDDQESGAGTSGHASEQSPTSPQPQEAPTEGRRGLLGRLTQPETIPETPGFNLADEIDNILQQKLVATGERTPVKIDTGLDGHLRIQVQGKFFQAVDEVEPPHIKALIQDAVKEWERR
jgi:hypothetical protein